MSTVDALTYLDLMAFEGKKMYPLVRIEFGMITSPLER